MKKLSFIIVLIFTVTLIFHSATDMQDDPKNTREFFRIPESMGGKFKEMQSGVKHIWQSLEKFYNKVATSESEYKVLNQIARVVLYPVVFIKKIMVKFGTFPTFLFSVLLFFSLTFMFKFRRKIDG